MQGDIVLEHVDAIVNASASACSGATASTARSPITESAAAGPALLDACRALPADAGGRRCPTGDVRITHGGDLPARHVIGSFGYPIVDAASIAIGAARDHLALNPNGPVNRVRFVLFDARTHSVFEKALAQVAETE